ncbi:MAG TPA: hypothetical protein VK034_08220 [Enhygromyxa sp.]|nr:hypothetical protein [Enhygromyxa sp.]
MAEAEAHAGRELLFAEVIARLVWLREADVLHGPCELSASDQPRELASPAALLWSWSRLISDTQQLLGRVLEPATREPGRMHQRSVSIERGRPRGAVHWPRTVQLGLRSVDSRGLRHVCSLASRSLLAPENLLLVLTLEQFVARGLLVGGHAQAAKTLGNARLDPLQRLRSQLRGIEGTPEFSAWREAARELKRSGLAAELALEQAVRERVQGRPSAAPEWARALLELRRQPAAIPSRSAIASIDDGTLWQQLAALELLCALRRRGVIRQADQGFVGARGLMLRPILDTPAWVMTAPGREPVGVLWLESEDWEQVRMHALYWSWTARHEDADIDRWVCFHRTGQPTLVRRRGPIELSYCDLQAGRGLGGQLDPALLGQPPISTGQAVASLDSESTAR